MIGGLRTITVLMLLAGVSLGVFASNLIARDPQPVTPVVNPRIESQVRYWRERYELDADATDRVRQALQRMTQRNRELILDLQQRHRDEFQAVVSETRDAIDAVLMEARAARGEHPVNQPSGSRSAEGPGTEGR